jgi:hypothetical protein
MPRGKGIYDDEKTAEQKEPADQDRDEGETPDVDERSEEPTA